MILELHNLPADVNQVREGSDDVYPLSKKLGLTHIGFSVRDMNPVLSLAPAEFEIIKGPLDVGDYKIAFLKNFEGIVIELVQPLPKE